MKYMTFNRSCSYACLANLLEKYGVDLTDRDIAIKMNLPYLFSYDECTQSFLAGPMLQGAEWFNLFLNPIGFTFVENVLYKEDILNYLNQNTNEFIIGLNLSNGKHAVIFKGYSNDMYHFMNVKYQHSDEPDQYTFNKDDLLERLDERIHIGYIKKIECKNVVGKAMFEQSLKYLTNYETAIVSYCLEDHEIENLLEMRDKLFAPLLLDTYSMMDIINKIELRDMIMNLRDQYIKALKLKTKIKLADYIDINLLRCIISEYKVLIQSQSTNTMLI